MCVPNTPSRCHDYTWRDLCSQASVLLGCYPCDTLKEAAPLPHSCLRIRNHLLTKRLHVAVITQYLLILSPFILSSCSAQQAFVLTALVETGYAPAQSPLRQARQGTRLPLHRQSLYSPDCPCPCSSSNSFLLNIGNQTVYSSPSEVAPPSGTAALISTGNSSSDTSLDHTLLFYGHITLSAHHQALINLIELSPLPACGTEGCSRHCSPWEPHTALCCRVLLVTSNPLPGYSVTLVIFHILLC